MTDGLFGIIIGFIFGVFVTMLLVSVYVGAWQDDEGSMYDDFY